MTDRTDELSVLEGRIAAAKAVGGVVHALWALSSSQLARVEATSSSASIYLDWVDEVVARLAGKPAPHVSAETLVVALGPERPFCGSLPTEIVRTLPRDTALGLCGTRLHQAIADQPDVAANVEFVVPGASSVDDLHGVTEQLAAAVLAHAKKRVVILSYPQIAAGTPRRVTLLSGARRPLPWRDFESYSSEMHLLEAAISESVIGRLRVGLAESLRAEIRARASAAESAKHAVERKMDELTSHLRQLHQERITRELTELYAGQLQQTRR